MKTGGADGPRAPAAKSHWHGHGDRSLRLQWPPVTKRRLPRRGPGTCQPECQCQCTSSSAVRVVARPSPSPPHPLMACSLGAAVRSTLQPRCLCGQGTASVLVAWHPGRLRLSSQRRGVPLRPRKIDLLTKAQGTGVANGRPTESSAGSAPPPGEKTDEVAVLTLVMPIGHVQQLLCSAPASGQIDLFILVQTLP